MGRAVKGRCDDVTIGTTFGFIADGRMFDGEDSRPSHFTQRQTIDL